MKKLMLFLKIVQEGFSLYIDIQLFLLIVVCLWFKPVVLLAFIFVSGVLYTILPFKGKVLFCNVILNTKLLQLLRLITVTVKRNIFVSAMLTCVFITVFCIVLGIPYDLSNLNQAVLYCDSMFPGYGFLIYALPGYSKISLLTCVEIVSLLETYQARIPIYVALNGSYNYYSYAGVGNLVTKLSEDLELTTDYYTKLMPNLENQMILSLLLIWILCSLLAYLIDYFKQLYKVETLRVNNIL